jgi:hypothetical protein
MLTFDTGYNVLIVKIIVRFNNCKSSSLNYYFLQRENIQFSYRKPITSAWLIGCIVNRFLKTPLLIFLPDTHLDHVQIFGKHTQSEVQVFSFVSQQVKSWRCQAT